MLELLYRVTTTLKSFFRESTNKIILLLIINIILTLYVYIESCNERYHYYKNLTTSLEAISGQEFDIYNGEVKKKLKTEEQLIRKQNRKFHLKYLFK